MVTTIICVEIGIFSITSISLMCYYINKINKYNKRIILNAQEIEYLKNDVSVIRDYILSTFEDEE